MFYIEIRVRYNRHQYKWELYNESSSEYHNTKGFYLHILK